MTSKEQYRAGSVVAGRYQLREPLGGGGLGQVYRAWDVQGQRPVAVKVFIPGRVTPDALQRYGKLIAVAGRLGHPGLVLPKGLGLASKDPPLVAMESLAGDDAGKLRARLGRLPWARALDLAAQCAEILHAVYAATKVPHRDLKPSNIFVTEKGEVRVLDYGIAEFDIQSADSTRVDTALGTVDYKAPEQLEGAATGECTDVFSLGVVLYELVSGVLPYRGASYYETARAILMTEVPRIAEVAPEASVPLGVEGLIRRALAKRPEERFADLKAMAEAIAQVRRSPGVVGPMVQTATGTVIEADDDPTAAASTQRMSRVPGRSSMAPGAGSPPPADRTVVVEGGGPRTLIGETTGAGPRTVIGETTGAGWSPPADRTVVHRTVVEERAPADRTVVLADAAVSRAPAESTMILPDASMVPSRQDTTMILPDPSAPARQDTTMILPESQVRRPESTMALPDAADDDRTRHRAESTMALPDAGEVALKVKARPKQEWPLQRTLIVVNVTCGLLILVGLLVMMLTR